MVGAPMTAFCARPMRLVAGRGGGDAAPVRVCSGAGGEGPHGLGLASRTMQGGFKSQNSALTSTNISRSHQSCGTGRRMDHNVTH